MTNTNNSKRKWKFPGYNVVCDGDDNALSTEFTTPELARAAGREIGTKLGKIVYAYLGNGREAIEPSPVVGMGCTLCYYTDRHAGTVIAVSASGHMVTVREDKAIRTDSNGMSDQQAYKFEEDPNGRTHKLYRQGDGRYGKGPRLVLGNRNAYHDYSF